MQHTINFGTGFQRLPDQSYLQECFDYNPDTGQLTWRVRPLHHFKTPKAMNTWNTRYAGTPAFTSVNKVGYYHGSVNGKSYDAQRIIWKLVKGYDPTFIDHDDHNRLNNKFLNLNETSRMDNQRNMSKPANNTSGVVGVGIHKPTGKWRAHLSKQYLGLFDTKEEAIEARVAAMKSANYHQNHGK